VIIIKITLVIIYYNELQYLNKLFETLLAQTIKADNIIFVNNNSPDDPSEIIEKYRKILNIDYVTIKENLFFTRGMNLGIRRAFSTNPDIIGLMNSDMWCDLNMIEEIKKYFVNNQDVIALTPNIKDLEDTKSVFYPLKYIGFFGKSVPINTTNDSDTDFLTGASLFVRTSVLKKTGLFYEPYFHGTEDFELCDKLRKEGKLKYIYSTNIHHQSIKEKKNKVSLQLEKLNSKNWYIYCLRNKPSNLILIKLALLKNIVGTIKGNTIDKQRLFGKLEGIKETFFHLTNKNKYL
jgi:GT2 family glycosyltransferase